MRDKLIELLSVNTCPNSICNFCEHYKRAIGCDKHKKGVIADHLIANGVTIQKWISASDRLPEPNQAVLCIGARGGMFISNKWRSDHNATPGAIWVNGQGWKGFTHWMPLPEPPKGE